MQFRSGRFLYMTYFSAIPIGKNAGFLHDGTPVQSFSTVL